MSDIKDICFKYFNGTSTVEQERMISEFISGNPDNRLLFEEWKSQWKLNAPDKEKVFCFNKVKYEIGRRSKAVKVTKMLFSVAVAAMLVLVAGVTMILVKDKEVPETCIVRTGYNEKTKVVLPDNSQVWLNANSSLTYSEDFIKEKREVYLTGEAFFDVTAMSDHPLVVHISGNDIVVKGTKFNVTAYSKESEISTSLIEGVIVFNSDKVSVEMVPGEQLVYNILTEDLTKTKVDTRSSFSWVNGKLDYTSVSLQKLLMRLSSLYGVEFKYNPIKYKNRQFRVKLNDSEPIEDVLSAISVILPIDYTINDKVVTVIER